MFKHMHTGCIHNINGFCEQYDYVPVDRINFKCDHYEVKSEKEKVSTRKDLRESN